MKQLVATLLLAAAVAAPVQIADPEAFVLQVLRAIAANPRDYLPPSKGIFTPQLQSLFTRDEKRAKGEVGCLDGDFWTDSQDPDGLRNIHATSLPSADPNRRTVVATFVLEHPKEIRYEFQRIRGRWLLDDVSSPKEPQWRLTKLLRCK